MKQAIPIYQKISTVFFLLVPVFIIALNAPVKADMISIHNAIYKVYGPKDTTNYAILILDENELPVVGVPVKVKRDGTGTQTTNAGGLVNVTSSPGETILVMLNKALALEYQLTTNRSPIIVLSSKNAALKAYKDVHLLFNTSLPANLTAASTETIYTNDLTKMPVTSVKSALAGRFAGLSTNQSSGQPGADEFSVGLHGQGPLVVIDGIARSITTLNLEEIESVTLLKDALSTAMYGIKGSNGVLLITTKRGSPSKQRISFTAQNAWQRPLKTPQVLGAFDYATLRNEAIANEGSVLPTGAANPYANLIYADADLQAYQTGSDPIGHPDVNWRSILLKPTSNLNRYSLNISGGSDVARYFVAFENFSQTGFLNTNDAANKYNTNNELNSYLIRSNIDVDITPKLTAGIHLYGRVVTDNQPGATTISNNNANGVGAIFSGILNTPNSAYPQFNPDGSFGSAQQYQNNLWAQSTAAGYFQNYTRNILGDFSLKRTLNEITSGLWIKGLASFSSNTTEQLLRTKPIFTSHANIPASGPITYTNYGTPVAQVDNNSILAQARQSYFELSLGYNHTFNNAHGVNVLLLANTDNSVNGSTLPYTVTGTSGRVSYNYKEKYVAEVAYGLNGTNYYQVNGNTTYGFFPAFGLAWNIDKESFLKKYTWISSLKLFGSYGKTGNDIASYFPSLQRYNNSTAYFGTAAGNTTGLVEGTLANPNLTWEKANKINVGLQGALFASRLGFSVEYYNNKFYDLLIQRGHSTGILGVGYPNENIGQNKYYGTDLQLTWQQTLNSKSSFFVSAVAGFQQSKVLFADEVNQPNSWMYRTGQKVGQAFGYTALGLIQTPSEAKTAATFVGYTPQPGDIKYLDRNHDGVINQLDQAPIGSTGPAINLGFNFGFNYKGFDFSALFQGAINRDVYVSGSGYWEFQNSGLGQAYQQQLNRWTPATAATATYPRLGIGYSTNNDIFSTYWYRSANYVRLKNIELGYTLPSLVTNAIRLRSARIFVNGTNMLTFTNLKDVDPEVSDFGTYPIQKLFNIGINIKL